jgi:hypothetical protein
MLPLVTGSLTIVKRKASRLQKIDVERYMKLIFNNAILLRAPLNLTYFPQLLDTLIYRPVCFLHI